MACNVYSGLSVDHTLISLVFDWVIIFMYEVRNCSDPCFFINVECGPCQ